MKKILLIVSMLFLISACVSTSNKDVQYMDTAKIRGKDIAVSYLKKNVQMLIGSPDRVIGSQEYYFGETEDDPTYILNFVDDSVQSIVKTKTEKK